MTNEQKQEFTRRITQANRSGLVLIKFEILFVYLDDAMQAHSDEDMEQFRLAIRHADAVLKSFEETLDFNYDLSAQLYALYDFHRRQIAKSLIRNSVEELQSSRSLLSQIYQAFQEAAKQDQSPPLMSNTQQVYAGYTYGKNDVNESYQQDQSRGFLA